MSPPGVLDRRGDEAHADLRLGQVCFGHGRSMTGRELWRLPRRWTIRGRAARRCTLGGGPTHAARPRVAHRRLESPSVVFLWTVGCRSRGGDCHWPLKGLTLTRRGEQAFGHVRVRTSRARAEKTPLRSTGSRGSHERPGATFAADDDFKFIAPPERERDGRHGAPW